MRSFSLLAGSLVALLSMGLAPAPTVAGEVEDADGAALDEIRRLVVGGHDRRAVSVTKGNSSGSHLAARPPGCRA